MPPSRYRPPEDVPNIDGLSPAAQSQLQVFLRRQFQRIAEDLDAATRNDALGQVFTDTRLDVPAGAKRRVTPPAAGMTAVLEAPSQFNAGAEVVLFVEAPRGSLKVVSAPGVDDGGKVFLPSVNGARQATYTAAGVITLRSNGSNAWSSPTEIPAESSASPQSIIESLPGAVGATGATGARGTAGQPAPPSFLDDDGVLLGMPGPPGATGSAGAQGAAVPTPQFEVDDDGAPLWAMPGPPGIQGPIGPTGPAGSGSASAPDAQFAFDDDGAPLFFAIPGVPGATGATGSTGSTGQNAAPATPFSFDDDGVSMSMFVPPLAQVATPLPTIQPGSFLGLQITAGGAVAAIEITGPEAGQNIRFDSWATSALTGNQADFVVALGTTGLRLTNASALNIQGFGLTGNPAGHPLLLAPQSGNPGVSLEHESASEGTAARRLQLPGGLNIGLFERECAVVYNDSAAGRMRLMALARARSAVQANGGTISPAETLNHVNGFGTTATCPVASGVAAPQVDVNFATQLQVDQGVATAFAFSPSLAGFRPGASQFQTVASVTNSTANNDSSATTINANVMVVGSTWLAIGYLTVVRGATNNACNLTISGIMAGVSQTEAPGGPLFVGTSIRAGGLVMAMFTCRSTGAGGTGIMRIWGLGAWAASNGTFGVIDLATATTVKAAFTVNTTINNNFGLRAVMSVAVPGLITEWTHSGVIRII